MRQKSNRSDGEKRAQSGSKTSKNVKEAIAKGREGTDQKSDKK